MTFLSFESSLKILALERTIYCFHAYCIVAIRAARCIGNVTTLLRVEIAQTARAI